jgi:SAM-dependent methyltransferase
MTTDYDPIADQYRRAKQQPWRGYLESFSLLSLIGDPTGLQVLDLACGDGFYTRLLRQRGAARLLGVDLSAGMIELARAQEAVHGLGITYEVGDARAVACHADFDLVVAAYLLNYARDRAELQRMYDAIASYLKPGGRFVTVNTNPALDWATAPSYRRYGFETAVTDSAREGAPLTWTFHLPDGSFSIENYCLGTEAHEAAMRSVGLRDICWHALQVSPEGMAAMPPGAWDVLLAAPPVIMLECRR